MAITYNLGTGPTAWYSTSQDGNVTVSVKSGSPLKPRAICVGTAILESYWINTGKTSSWHFAPKLLDPTQVQYIESTDVYQNQIITIDLGKRMFPASGFILPNLTGEIKAPAIHFDLPHAYDLWVAILRSPSSPLKIGIEKSLITISHSSAQAMAQIESGTADPEETSSLRADVSVNGEGFKKVLLSIKRSVERASFEETIGDLTNGLETFTWKPTTRTFNTILVTYSDMFMNHYVGLLQQLGAETNRNLAFRSYLPRPFVLCDGEGIDYTMRLTGDKHILGHEKDETKLTMTT
ncbi:MAG TPA: hypothetical protein VLU95_06595 [Candidatus Acidoferrum sp.]|nr:hypothetical protein [Candidatus Acidoferrum sp.]